MINSFLTLVPSTIEIYEVDYVPGLNNNRAA